MRGITFVERGIAAFTDEPMPVCAADSMLLQTVFSGFPSLQVPGITQTARCRS